MMVSKITKSLNKDKIVNVCFQKQKCWFGHKIRILFNDESII